MFTSLLFAALILIVVLVKYLHKPAQRCPECNAVRESDHPICACGYVFEFPNDDDEPFEYAESDDPSETR